MAATICFRMRKRIGTILSASCCIRVNLKERQVNPLSLNSRQLHICFIFPTSNGTALRLFDDLFFLDWRQTGFIGSKEI